MASPLCFDFLMAVSTTLSHPADAVMWKGERMNRPYSKSAKAAVKLLAALLASSSVQASPMGTILLCSLLYQLTFTVRLPGTSALLSIWQTSQQVLKTTLLPSHFTKKEAGEVQDSWGHSTNA